MNLEHEFISKIIETESMRAMIEKRINPDFFKGRFRPIYQFMYNYYKDYRKTPSLDVIKREFPDFDTDIPQEPLDYYVDELRDRKTYEIMINGIEGLADLIEQREIEEAKDTLYKLQSKIATEVTVSRDINYADDIEARIERYLHKKENMGVDGIPIGIDAIDNTTSGAHKGELITIAARPGTGKTWFEIAVVAKHALENNYRLLFITKEMEPEQIALRMDAPLLGYGYDKLRMGALGNKSESEYFEKLHEIAAEYNDFVISGDDGEGTVTDVQAKIDEHKPDLVIVDGSYLLRDEEGGRSFHEKAMNITRGLKRVARNTEIPLYNSTQANRQTGRKRAPEMEDVAFSDAYAQDSDVLISLYRTEEMKISNKLGVKLAKVREGDDAGHYLLNWDFNDMANFGSLAQDKTEEEPEPEEDEDMVIM